ncbi:hypothetical protein PVAP13_7NG052089 [Panicum virgatum]|uniref:Agenet-like domain-containing protein n=1 Tax=Panicum virgatum TaxID=38727 RepID=A0A8T0PQS7_PANVG|nr:hypothetical protein PVAP13_7NG052089 [Panicum virgatum]
MAVRPSRVVRVYEVGDKVEVGRDWNVYGYSWFPATVARVIDGLSYLVEYFDLEDDDKKAVEYLHWRFIRPAVEHLPSAYCDGAWSPGVVRRAVGEGEFEVCVADKKGELLVTKLVELLKPHYKWNGKQWKIVPAKRQTKLRRSLSGKSPSSPVDATSSGDEQSQHSTPQNESIPNSNGETVDNQEILSEMNVSDGQINSPVCGASADDAHDMLPIAELRKKMASARRNTPKVKKGISKRKVGKPHPIQELQGKNGASDNLKGNINFCIKDIVCALSASVESQTTTMLDRQVSRHTKRGSRTKWLTGKDSKELCSPHSSLDVTSTVQQMRRKEVVEPMKESPLAARTYLDRSFEDTPTITELSNQDDLFLAVPPGFESMYNGKGADINGSLLEEEPTVMINNNSQVQANRNDDVCTDHASTEVARSNHVMQTAIPSPDCPVQQAGGKVDERSVLGLQNAGRSQCTMNCSPLRSCSASGSSLPSPSAFSRISDYQVPFVKSSPLWPLIEAMDDFKEVPQHPHFLPLRESNPALREGMALGLMVTYADLVKGTREASIDNSMKWFEDKISILRQLDTLTKLVQVKSNRTCYLEEINKLKAEIVGKTTYSAQIDALLDEKDIAIAELDQKIAKEKENEEAELLNLKSVRSRFEEAYGDAERQFQSILAELHRKKLT